MPTETAAPGIKFELAQPPRAAVEVRSDIAGLVGFAARGPFHRATRIESWQQFESVFGGLDANGFLPLAAHAFFENGGATCYVVRVLVPGPRSDPAAAAHAAVEIPMVGGSTLRVVATSPGSWGNRLSVEVEPRSVVTPAGPRFRCTVVVRDGGGGVWRLADCSLEPADPRFLAYVMDAHPDLPVRLGARHTGRPDEEGALRTPPQRLVDAVPGDLHLDPDGRHAALRATLDLPFGAGARLEARTWQLGAQPGTEGRDGLAGCQLRHLTGDENAMGEERWWGARALDEIDEVAMIAVPDAAPFPRTPPRRSRPPRVPGCDQLDSEPAPVAAASPPPTELPPSWSERDMAQVAHELIRVCELRGDCVTLLDAPCDLLRPLEVEQYRSRFDSSVAALYWPWLLVERAPRAPRTTRERAGEYGYLLPPENALHSDPIGLREAAALAGAPLIAMPPSGLVAGLTAWADLRVGPHRTPAGQTARGAVAVTVVVGDDDHGMLNGRGINVFRERAGRGVVLEGTRSLTQAQRSGSPWRHFNVRRAMLTILEMLDERTQWAVFEPNSPLLWADLRDVLRALLTRRWQQGWLSGARAEDAFYVRCDETTNPPESVALGMIVAQIGLRFPPPIGWIVVNIGRSNAGVEVLDVERA